VGFLILDLYSATDLDRVYLADILRHARQPTVPGGLE
jgi:hypothetical protein